MSGAPVPAAAETGGGPGSGAAAAPVAGDTAVPAPEATPEATAEIEAVAPDGHGGERPAWRRRRALLPALVLALALPVALTLAVSLGATSIPAGEVWSVVGRRLAGQPARPGTTDLVVWQLRVPRALLAALVGAGLALAGTAVQALVRNPLADPYLLGISSGASFGAVAYLVLGAGAGGLLGLGLTSAAFAGALLAFGLVWGMTALARGGGFAPLRLVLAGVAIGQFLSGVTSYLVLRAGDAQQVQGVLFWLMGSLGGATWDDLAMPALTVAAALLWLLARARPLNALALGDESAAGAGVRVAWLRRELFVVTSLLTAALVAVAGAIAFVGLMVPHACRLLVGGDHRRTLPLAALGGAVLMVVVDVLCRTAVDGQELPAGVVTSVLGAPALLWLLGRR